MIGMEGILGGRVSNNFDLTSRSGPWCGVSNDEHGPRKYVLSTIYLELTFSKQPLLITNTGDLRYRVESLSYFRNHVRMLRTIKI